MKINARNTERKHLPIEVVKKKGLNFGTIISKAVFVPSCSHELFLWLGHFNDSLSVALFPAEGGGVYISLLSAGVGDVFWGS